MDDLTLKRSLGESSPTSRWRKESDADSASSIVGKAHEHTKTGISAQLFGAGAEMDGRIEARQDEDVAVYF